MGPACENLAGELICTWNTFDSNIIVYCIFRDMELNVQDFTPKRSSWS